LSNVNEKWNQRYANPSAEERPPEGLVVDIAETRPPGRALDVACGLGRNALYLASKGWEVTAVDSSSVAIHVLRERASEGLTVEAVLADLENDEFVIRPGHWDLIVDCCYLQRSLFPAIRAGVREGGAFVGVFPMKGINPAYLMRAGEGREIFEGWKLWRYSEGERLEILAEKPRAAV
jgi:tellurite methyltransferase